jgi:hypothetical protein
MTALLAMVSQDPNALEFGDYLAIVILGSIALLLLIGHK